MAIDTTLFVASPTLQDYLVDKDTGAPLSDGVVTFYRDNARSILKNVYYQTGSPPNYSYVALPNPLTLSAVGTIANEFGEDVIPFFYPYDENDETIAQPYYVTVESSGGISQFTRENFPFVPASSSSNTGQQTLINLIPNGQFTAHNNLKNNVYPNGQTSVVVAPGGSAGWYFAKPSASTSTDNITFTQILAQPDNLPGDPRYIITLSCSNPEVNATYKELRVRFNNVNRFASDTQQYTFGFTGINNASDTVNVNFNLIKYFGTGGSPSTTTEQTIETFTLQSGTYTEFSTSFVFGSNNSSTIGTNNDDYIELAIALTNPGTDTYNLSLGCFILTPGALNLTDYPQRPDNIVFANGIAGSMPTPAYDGSDLYCPLVLTPGGFTFDHSGIGQIFSSIYSSSYSSSNNFAQLLCDGTSYIYANYSSIYIPYLRLGNVLINDSPIANTPKYGTGANFATAYATAGNTSVMRLTVNTAGSVTASANFNVTGLTAASIHTGTSSINYNAYSNIANTVLCVPTFSTRPTAADAHTSGFTITNLNPQTGLTAAQNFPFTVLTIAASSMTAGTYFTFSNASTNYYMWFKIDGSGSDPAPGGTGIEVDILSTYTAQDVANCVREAVNQYQISTLLFGSVPATSQYWTFSTNPSSVVNYYVWYKVGGTGTDPAPSGKTGIQVTLTGSENTAQVATATLAAINKYQYATPDFRGTFQRMLDPSGIWDLDVAQRWSTISALSGANLGTFEFQQLLNHYHFLDSNSGGAANPQTAVDRSPPANSGQSGFTGGSETRPVNAAVNFFIKY